MRSKTISKMRVISVIMSLLMVISVISFPTLNANADGSAGTLDDFVERCYTVTLDRPSDVDGFNYWKGRVLNGEAVGIEVAYGFLFSPEYTKKNKSNSAYVRDLYTLFMGRDPDDAGYNDWMNRLDEGQSRLDVFVGFANSQEFYNICESYGITAGRYVAGYDRNTINNVNLFVERMYKICLGRIGDKDGQNDWAEKLMKKEISGSECARSFIFSREYINKGLSDEEYVENLYLAIMGRPSDAKGKADWIAGLESGKTRDEVFAGFVNSHEFAEICNTYKIDRGSYTAKDVSKNYKVGDIIKFGKYEQDGNLENGKEDIEWIILSVEDSRILVISKYGLDEKMYHEEKVDITWEKCTLRNWLNNDFLNAAFNEDEKKKIPSVTLENKDNPVYGTPGGNSTVDKVFCLSIDEMEKYFGEYDSYDSECNNGYNQKLMCTPTQYAINNGAWYHTMTDSDYTRFQQIYTSDYLGFVGTWWWLRSPGSRADFASDVSDEGNAGAWRDDPVQIRHTSVRPAIYIEY